MKRRIVFALLCSGLLTTALVGCKSQNSAPASDAAERQMFNGDPSKMPDSVKKQVEAMQHGSRNTQGQK